jgi:pimeloyl-ACP methyl ester carboxylesterase
MWPQVKLRPSLDALHLNRVSLAGMSYGGWIALGYAVAAPERVQKLVLLSAGGFLPMAKQFTMRGMLMVFWPIRFTRSVRYRPGRNYGKRLLKILPGRESRAEITFLTTASEPRREGSLTHFYPAF